MSIFKGIETAPIIPDEGGMSAEDMGVYSVGKHESDAIIDPYYEGKGGVIYHGDCLDIIPHLANVDLVCTDPPFFMPAQSSSSRIDWSRSWSDTSILATWFDTVFKAMVDRLRRPGRVYVCCDGPSHAVFYPALYRRFLKLSTLVWDKGKIGLGNPYRHSYELILHANDKGAYWGGTKGQSDILRHSPQPSSKRKHPVDKPVSLFCEVIVHGCREGGVVLDSFMGGGSTLVAALSSGRRAIGIEGEEQYCEVAAKRLESL